jgi:hypothetical protein
MTESTRLFTLRLWSAAETGDGNPPQWHGKSWRGKSLPDGEAYNFGDWLDLIRALEAMLATRPEETQEE